MVIARGAPDGQVGPSRLEVSFDLSESGDIDSPPRGPHCYGLLDGDVAALSSGARIFKSSWGAVYFCASPVAEASELSAVLKLSYRQLGPGETVTDRD